MAEIRKSAWKTCSHSHKYRGSRCRYCWKNTKGKESTIFLPQTRRSFSVFSKYGPFGTAAGYRKLWRTIFSGLMDEETPV